MELLPKTAQAIIKKLQLEKIREGVYIRRSYSSELFLNGRAAASSAWALATWDAPSYLHRLDCDEIWHFYAGSPLNLYILEETGLTAYKLGGDVLSGQLPEIIIPKGSIFGALAEKEEDWCLFGCTCVPAFELTGYEYIRADAPALTAFPKQRQLIEKLTSYK